MISSIITYSLGLFVAVTVIYLITWYNTHDQTISQTVAFFAWLVGHVLLAFNLRSEREPVFRLGLGSNRLMLVWGAAVAAFLILVSIIPGAQHLLKIAPLSGMQWVMISGTTLLGTFWIEIRKLITYHWE